MTGGAGGKDEGEGRQDKGRGGGLSLSCPTVVIGHPAFFLFLVIQYALSCPFPGFLLKMDSR